MTVTSAFRRVPSPAAKPRICCTGQTLVEWSLLLALIGITCAASLSQVGIGINTALTSTSNSLMGNMGGPSNDPGEGSNVSGGGALPP